MRESISLVEIGTATLPGRGRRATMKPDLAVGNRGVCDANCWSPQDAPYRALGLCCPAGRRGSLQRRDSPASDGQPDLHSQGNLSLQDPRGSQSPRSRAHRDRDGTDRFGTSAALVTEEYSRPATLEDLKALIRSLNDQGADYLLI